MQECAKETASEPPHDSSLALRTLTPDSVADVRTGYVLDGLAMPVCSAPESVMILNVEPGGCGPETASPARPEHVAGARLDDRDAAEAVAERGRRGRLQAEPDRACARCARA